MKVNYRRLIQVLILAGSGLLFVAALFGPQPADRASAGTPPPVETPRVAAAVLDALQTNPSTDFVLEMGEQPDLSHAYEITDWVERGRYVVDMLQANAQRRQARALGVLNSRGLRHRSFFAANEIYVYSGDTSALQALLALPEVARVRAPVTVSLQPTGLFLRRYGPAAPVAQLQSVVDWGITDTKADQFWSTFQSTGQGILVANIDTGVDVTHPALAGAYRCAGGTLTNPVCWNDPTVTCKGQVCDDNGHGTHTMGTMVASNDPTLAHTVGMAPGAQWIACKAFTSNGQGKDVDLLACAEWILAPGGDPANRPQVVNNSWGDIGGNTWFLNEVDAWSAAGIFPAFSAGNFYTCNSLGSPGDYQVAFASAAHTSTRLIAAFSSRGPSLFGDSPYTKPNLSAPGLNILSTIPGNKWESKNGTSMASPHSAGAVALLWSCAPSLTGQIDATFQLLQSSADAAPAGACGVPASGQGNYTFGYGYLNVLAAGNQICSARQIKGNVRDSITDNPIADAVITLADGINQPVIVNTDINGKYSDFLQPGNYTLQAKAYGYLPQTISNIKIKNKESTTVNFSLVPAQLVTVSGMVRDGSGQGWPLSARLTYTELGQQVQAQTDPASGAYSIELYQQNEYQVKVEALDLDYLPATDTVIPLDTPLVRDYALLVNPDTCAALGYYRLGGLTQSFESLALPAGWSMIDNLGSGQVWTFTDPLHIGNHTGASGGFAWVNSLIYSGLQDSSLVTPLMNFASGQTVTLNLNTDYLYNPVNPSAASIDLSLDGGETWTSLWKRTDQNFTGGVPQIDLTAQAAGKSNVQLRFHFTNASNSGWWQIDNVVMSPPPSCLALKDRIFLPVISRNVAP